MKVVGIQIEGSAAILVVLEQNDDRVIQTSESIKFGIGDHLNAEEVRQFRDQVKATLDSIAPDQVGMIARNAKAKGTRAPSSVSFKLEGVFQLYKRSQIEMVWPQTISAFYKKNILPITVEHKYQQKALELAFYLISK